ncbi:MAG: rhomboid family intramembrane serine protease [Eubacterium sp.]|nr:rhomboid family intramembrane serine protease [Eubacterium sp.]
MTDLSSYGIGGGTPSGEKKPHKFRIRYNAPVTLTFAFASLAVLGLGYVTNGWTTENLFSVYRSKFSFFWIIRLFGHTLGHANMSHFFSNMTLFLLLGPVLEEKYGSKNLLEMIGISAVIASIFQMIFFSNTMLLGASGIVFMMIILTSAVNMKEGGIPLSMILVILIYLGSEIWDAFTVKDSISHLTHILGGICGAVFGFLYAKDPKLKDGMSA